MIKVKINRSTIEWIQEHRLTIVFGFDISSPRVSLV